MTDENKNIKIIVDRSEELKQAQATIDQLNQKIGSQQEILKKYLEEDAEKEREKAIRVNEPKKQKPEEYSPESAPLEDEHIARNIDFANSEFLDMMRFPSVEKCIQTTECLAHKGSPDARRAMLALTRKILKKPISLEFSGSVKQLATESERPIPEICDNSTRKQLEARNARIRANRLAWKELS